MKLAAAKNPDLEHFKYPLDVFRLFYLYLEYEALNQFFSRVDPNIQIACTYRTVLKT